MKYKASLQECVMDGDSLIIQISRFCKSPKTVIPLLVDYGADVNDKGKIGMTPLATACAMPNPEDIQLDMVRTLLKYGADINAKTDDGVSVLNVAVKNPLVNLGLVELLLNNGAEINCVDKGGNNVLMGLFSCNPNPYSVIELLSKYTDLDFFTTNYHGANLLMIAALHNTNPSVIDFLLDRKVNTMLKDKNGYGLQEYGSQNTNSAMQQKIKTIMSKK